MIKYIIIPIFVFLIIAEWLTYRGFIKDTTRKNKLIYLSLSAIVYLFLIISTAIAFNTVDPLAMAVMTWAVLLLLINIKVKVLFAIAAVINIVARGKVLWVQKTAFTLSGVAIVVILWGVIFGRNDVRVEYVTIESPEIPAAFDGYKIAQFSDAHLGNLLLTNVVEEMVETINEMGVDLVVQSGDLVNMRYNELTDDYIEMLSDIKSKDGVVSVFGNHDLGFYLSDTTEMTPRETVEGLRAVQRNILGWKLLENEQFVLRRGVDSIVIAGVTYPKNMNHNNYNSIYGGSDIAKAMKGVKDSTFSILVSHTPKLFDSVPAVARPDLTLSGHVHSMQIQLNIGGWKWSPASWMYRQYSGLYSDGEYKLYINDGLGYVLFPFRLGTRPEITIFTLKHKKY